MMDVPFHRAIATSVKDLCRRVLPSALLAFSVVELPALFNGPIFWLWGALAAVVGVAAAPMQGRRSPGGGAWWPCAIAASAGFTVDFVALPPPVMLSLCRSGSEIDFRWAAVEAHVRWFPATSIAMLLVITVTELRARAKAALKRPEVVCLRALPGIALDFAVMLAAMSMSVEAFRAIAGNTNLPWTADGMCVAMLAGMLCAPSASDFATHGRRALQTLSRL